MKGECVDMWYVCVYLSEKQLDLAGLSGTGRLTHISMKLLLLL